MKAMGYAQQVIESISFNTSNGVLSWIGKKSGETSGSGSFNIKDVKVNNSGYADGAGNSDKLGGFAADTYAKKSDPNSTIEVGKLKLKNPYTLSPDNNDVLCAFDASDGELSKTNLKVKDVANIDATYATKTDKNNIVSCIKGLFGDKTVSNYYYGICPTWISIGGDDRQILTIDAANYGFSRIEAVIAIPVKYGSAPNLTGSVDNPFFLRKVSDTQWYVYVDYYDSNRFNYCYALVIGRNYYNL